MKNHFILCLLIVVGTLCLLTITSCQEETKTPPPTTTTTTKPKTPAVKVPDFDASSAYNFIKKQVDFGPRVPGTPAHKACAEWLENTLKEYSESVIVQTAEVTVYDGTQVPMYNIIASFNPESKKRIMLSAHWDTRPFADQDTERVNEPIDGANDGGSGVGVLLEIARQLKQNPTEVGIDIFLWDVEDYGKGGAETYCLGSQYWSRNPHIPGYKAEYGILLDMVGAKNAVFQQEGHSNRYARPIVNKVWTAAHKAGYRSFFPFREVGPITDDHYFINILTRIPTIDIIQYDQNMPNGFGSFWHTHDDNMEVIDKRTLKAVGQTVMTVIYQER